MESWRSVSVNRKQRAQGRSQKGRRTRRRIRRSAGRAISPPKRRKPNGGDFAVSIQEFEALEELIGKIVSFAGLVYAGDTSDPKRAKLYGDIQQKMTDASTHLIFYSLELNRIDDAMIEKAMANNPAIGHYRPWLVDLRKDKPYQLDDKLEQLFHEKSITGRGAWNRLFDETMTALRFEVNGEELPLEPTLNLLQDADANVRKTASEALAKTFKENLRIFTLITNTLAKDKEISDRWRGFEDIADSRHLANRVEREVVDALAEAVQDAYPRLVASLLRAEGEVARSGISEQLGPQRAAAGNAAGRHFMDGSARNRAFRLSRLRPGNGRYRQAVL